MTTDNIKGIIATAHTDSFQPLVPRDPDTVVGGGYSTKQAREVLLDFFNFLREDGPQGAGLGIIILAWWDPDQSRYRDLEVAVPNEELLIGAFREWASQQ